MAAEQLECANCGARIGKLETPRVFNEQVVCVPCWKKLHDQDDTIAGEPAPPPAAPVGFEDSMLAELGRASATPAPYETRAQAAARMRNEEATRLSKMASRRVCPACGSSAPPVRKRKGSLILFLFLFLLMVLPAILYALLNNGYLYACPKCGAKISDAT